MLNTGFVAVEAFYGWKVDSLALLADAAHNLGDVAGLVLAWAGAWAARLQPDARHTYGFKRASILAAFANALLLLGAMGSLAWEAVGRLGAPLPHTPPGFTVIVVAGIGIVVNAATALLFMRGSQSDLNVRGAFLHMAADALVSAGVVVAGGLTLWQGWAWLDPVVSLLIAGLILVSTWALFRRSLHWLLDGVPEHIDLSAVQGYLASQPGVSRVSELRVWALGSSHVALTAHLIRPHFGHDSADGDRDDDRNADRDAESDAFLRDTTAGLKAKFGIDQVTLQVMRAPLGASSTGLTGAGRAEHAEHAAAHDHPAPPGEHPQSR